jgi:hypothetical protein
MATSTIRPHQPREISYPSNPFHLLSATRSNKLRTLARCRWICFAKLSSLVVSYPLPYLKTIFEDEKRYQPQYFTYTSTEYPQENSFFKTNLSYLLNKLSLPFLFINLITCSFFLLLLHVPSCLKS